MSFFIEVKCMVCPVDDSLQVAEGGVDPGEAISNYFMLMLAPGL
jgi:hypothetical protein